VVLVDDDNADDVLTQARARPWRFQLNQLNRFPYSTLAPMVEAIALNQTATESP
jgi:hypothetical protein